MSGLTVPTYTVQVAFQDIPFATSPTWTDITLWVESVTTTSGRQHELQQVNPSTATINLWNGPYANQNGGRFSPWNTASPYYYSGTGLTPGHPVRIQATWLGTTYNIFYGYTKAWVPQYGQTSSEMRLECYDTLALLNLDTLDNPGYDTLPIASANSWWPLNDPPNSATAADKADSNPLTATAGGSVIFGLAPGPFLTSPQTSVQIYPGGILTTPGSINLASFTSVSVDGWVKTGAGAGLGITLFNCGGVVLKLDGSSHASASINATTVSGSTVLTDNNWHYLALTWDGATLTLYVDGTKITSGPVSGTLTSSQLQVGFNTGGASAEFAQVAIYTNTTLSGTQVNNQWQLGSATWIVQDSGARVNAVLGVAGLPAGLISTETGTVTVAAATSNLATSTVMSYLNQVVNTERGFLFQDPTGVVQFYNREHVYTTAASTTSNATYGYAAGQLHYFAPGLTPTQDDLDLWNNINVNRQGGILQNASDSSSQSSYGRRTLTGLTSLLFSYDTDSYDLASGLLYQYKNPHTRVRAITQDSTIGAGANLPNMLGRKLLDRITINWRPIDGSGVDFSQQSLIEQITHTFSPAKWTTSWAVTPIGTEAFWILGTSQLGTGTILGF